MDKTRHLESKYSIARYWLIRNCESSELHLYLYLKLYAINRHEAFPSFRTVQKDLGWSMDKISKTVKKMKQSGRLKVTQDKGKNNVYDITWYDRANQGVLRKPEQGCSGNQSRGALKTRAELIDNITNRNITNNIDPVKKSSKSENQFISKGSWTKELLKKLEEIYGSKLTRRSIGIQLKALGELKDAGYAPEEILAGLERMRKDNWWKDKNPDYRNLAQNSLKFMPKKQKAGKYSHLAIKD
ncbi:hypothetical protein ANME2D_02498 [Candidatus Methanoperedens nitroreducens]|uniref:Helix-turn-helix domain-containing protein n=1 Tax=Candidatus Methanoperedens nitratireducens TaxID=1392998 RepID=A0A062UWA8_9EURY|nr:hypothetical protein [Candidatus Methanoperedens nitroreducens]KCZ71296.1 hypothetical protein ANME2D_02498 [Candidatus Methanoperedens nitroreducens]MDJ1423767.1 hypothetical protein [Candidatus Methanoperedens sp.]